MGGDEILTRPEPPALVRAATELRHAFQSGNDERMLELMRPGEMRSGLVEVLARALYSANDRTLTYAAPQIAALAERVGYVQEQPS